MGKKNNQEEVKSWLVPSQPDLGREVVPLNSKDGALLQPLGGGGGKKRKKPKAVALALLSLKGKADVLMS